MVEKWELVEMVVVSGSGVVVCEMSQSYHTTNHSKPPSLPPSFHVHARTHTHTHTHTHKESCYSAISSDQDILTAIKKICAHLETSARQCQVGCECVRGGGCVRGEEALFGVAVSEASHVSAYCLQDNHM